jgi:DUF2993 family protein
MRRFLVVVLVLLLAIAIADVALKSLAERRIEGAIQEELDLTSRPEVTIRGWPFIVRVLRGEFNSVIVVADGISARGLDLRDIRLEFHDVRFSLGQIILGDERRVRVDRAAGTAAVTAGELNSELRARDVPATVDFIDGQVVVSSTELNVGASAAVSIDSGRLVVTPEGGLDPLTFDLPQFTKSVTYRSVRIEDARAILRVEIGPTTLEF